MGTTARTKTICHVDMDAFFVSVEEVFDPSLKGKPVVVGGSADQRGVVSAASYAARKYGVHSAMPLRTAYALCPHAIFVHGDLDRYREYSRRVHSVLERFSPVVEMASIDEAYVDLTGTDRLHGPPLKAAHLLHEAMKRETALNCSIGIARSRLVAKVASDQAKPNGVLQVWTGQEARFLAPLPVRKIPGVGKVMERNLSAIGIRFVGDLARLDEEFLQSRFGKWGLALAGKSKGEDAGGWFDAEVGEGEDPKSISHEHTFSQDVLKADVLETTLAKLSEMVARRVRQHGFRARTVQLKLRYSDFRTCTRAETIDNGTEIDVEIFHCVRDLFRKAWTGEAVRLLGVQTSGFEDSEGQMHLLDTENTEKWRKALHAVDALRDKFGKDSVSLATGMSARIRERVHENAPGLPGKEPTRAKPPDKEK